MPTRAKKPNASPATPFPTAPDTLHREGNWLWIPLRGEWREVSAKPEEVVRQSFIRHLIDHYGYSLVQMDQERRTMHGHKSPRADVVIWETPEVKAKGQKPVLVIECKAESVDINLNDYYQGEATRAPLVASSSLPTTHGLRPSSSLSRRCRATSCRSTKSRRRPIGVTQSG